MFRRGGVLLVLIALVLGSLPLADVRAQSEGPVVVVGPESAREPIEAWVEAYGAVNGAVSFEVQFEPSEEAVLNRAAEADVLFYSDYEQDPPIEFECGVISEPYVALPELGARWLSSVDCGDTVSSKTPIMRGFLQFVVGPDGQQVAIELGLLPDSVEVVDQAGVTVTVPQPVRRIISAYSMATYYAYTLGAGDQLAAATYLGMGGSARQDIMRRVDPDFDRVFTAISDMSQDSLNLEEAAALQPDLILTSARTTWLETAGELGLPIIRFEGESPERLQAAMELLGAVLGPNAAYRAAQFNAYYDHVLEQVLSQTEAIADPARVYFSGTDPLRTASGEMYQASMIEAAGGELVSADLPGYWNDVNLEQVLTWEPEVIFVVTYGGASVEAITESEEWAVVEAVQAGRVYQLPHFISPWDTPVPDSILGIIWMAQTLYPDQVTLDCASQVRGFYARFYDYRMSEEEAQSLCE